MGRKRAMSYQVNFEIGDWSHDGHNESETIKVFSNRPVEHLRETHFLCPSKLGFDIGDICRDCEEDVIGEDVVETLEEVGFDMEKYSPECPDGRQLIQLWVDILMHIDPELELYLETPEEREKLPSMHFYGYDKNNRHLRVPGYGLFGY